MSGGVEAGLLLNFRDARRSARCIRSLLDEGVAHVLVWDNSGDDGASASELRGMFSDEARVHLVSSGRNLGFAAGVNRGMRECLQRFNADVVIVINNDALLRAEALTALRKTAHEHPDVAVISMDIDHAGHRQGPMFYQRWSGLQFTRPVAGAFAYASGCCLWVNMHRAPAPLLDEAFFMYGEDCELGWRLSRVPGAWVHLPQALVTHEGSASSGLGTAFYETHMVAAHLLLARKLARHRSEAVWFSLMRVPMLLARAGVRSLRFHQ